MIAAATSEKVGALEILFKTRLLLPIEEIAVIKFPIGETVVVLQIQFSDETSDDKKSEIQILGDGNNALIKFINWNNSLGTTTNEPAQFANTGDGKKIKFFASSHRNGLMNQLDLQFMLETRV